MGHTSMDINPDVWLKAVHDFLQQERLRLTERMCASVLFVFRVVFFPFAPVNPPIAIRIDAIPIFPFTQIARALDMPPSTTIFDGDDLHKHHGVGE